MVDRTEKEIRDAEAYARGLEAGKAMRTEEAKEESLDLEDWSNGKLPLALIILILTGLNVLLYGNTVISAIMPGSASGKELILFLVRLITVFTTVFWAVCTVIKYLAQYISREKREKKPGNTK